MDLITVQGAWARWRSPAFPRSQQSLTSLADEKAVFDILRQINAQDTLKGSTPLMHAIEFNNSLKLIEALVGAGAKIDAKDFVGDSALHIAARENRVDVAKYLVGIGAKKTEVNMEGKTPLEVAETPDMKAALA